MVAQVKKSNIYFNACCDGAGLNDTEYVFMQKRQLCHHKK